MTENKGSGKTALIVVLLLVVLGLGYYFMQEQDNTVFEANVGGEEISVETSE